MNYVFSVTWLKVLATAQAFCLPPGWHRWRRGSQGLLLNFLHFYIISTKLFNLVIDEDWHRLVYPVYTNYFGVTDRLYLQTFGLLQ